MKNLIYVAAILLFISCANDGAKEEIAEEEIPVPERSIGFQTNLPELKWHIGTEAAVQLVKDLDKSWSSNNYEAMRPLLSDTAKFYFADGRKATSPNEFIKILSEDESGDTWTFDYAYSVDLSPEVGGEHVQAGFKGTAISEGDTTNTFYHESYYIIEGKIVRWIQYSLKPKKE